MLPGHGEEALETEKDFSRYGRVNYVLKTRLELLNEVNFYFFIFLIWVCNSSIFKNFFCHIT